MRYNPTHTQFSVSFDGLLPSVCVCVCVSYFSAIHPTSRMTPILSSSQCSGLTEQFISLSSNDGASSSAMMFFYMKSCFRGRRFPAV